jgi:hypothetical protein
MVISADAMWIVTMAANTNSIPFMLDLKYHHIRGKGKREGNGRVMWLRRTREQKYKWQSNIKQSLLDMRSPLHELFGI